MRVCDGRSIPASNLTFTRPSFSVAPVDPIVLKTIERGRLQLQPYKLRNFGGTSAHPEVLGRQHKQYRLTITVLSLKRYVTRRFQRVALANLPPEKSIANASATSGAHRTTIDQKAWNKFQADLNEQSSSNRSDQVAAG